MKKQGRPATGRKRSVKLHIWIDPVTHYRLLDYCERTGLSKADAVTDALKACFYANTVACAQPGRF